jgi:hypothetical protein
MALPAISRDVASLPAPLRVKVPDRHFAVTRGICPISAGPSKFEDMLRS